MNLRRYPGWVARIEVDANDHRFCAAPGKNPGPDPWLVRDAGAARPVYAAVGPRVGCVTDSTMAPARTARPVGLAKASATGDLAAVDVQDLAGDVRRRLQEQDTVDHVADLPGPA